MEIEGAAAEIEKVEKPTRDQTPRGPKHATYPQLTARHGKSCRGLIEARFER